jgi:uncharacterized protein (DUF1800 family)
MSISRREVIFAGGATIALSGCGRLASEVRRRRHKEPWQDVILDADARLIDRITFGWTSEEASKLKSLGKQAYIDEKLFAKNEEPFELVIQLQSLDCVRLHSVELMEIPKGRVTLQLQCAAILRATYGSNQLLERMVDFWSNHFNIYAGKGDGTYFKGNEEENIIRKHALGNFGDMVRAMTKAPAMLLYLDNNQNYKGHPNENFARELLELHTLGIDGGYTQIDIQEVARCLTGWTMEKRAFHIGKGSFRFDETLHDDNEKVVLGKRIPSGGGVKDGEKVLDILINHRATAAYLAKKLVFFFTGSQSKTLEERVALKYQQNNGNIAEMVRVVLDASEIVEGPPIIRRPFDFVCAALRRSGAATDGGADIQQYLRRMGQPLYEWPMPDGYPVDQLSWGTNMLPRWQFSYDLAHGKITNTSVPSTNNPIKLAAQIAEPKFQYM